MSDIRVCFLGDSFVNGTGDDTALGWVGRVCAAARAKGVNVTSYNLGIRRNTSLDVLARWEDECRRRIPLGVDGRVVLSFGVNDTMMEMGGTRVASETSLDAFRQIVERARRDYRVLFVGPTPVADDSHNPRIEQLAARLLAEADRLGVPRIDLFTPLVEDADYRRQMTAGDGAHPVAAGYARMAALVMASTAWWFGDRYPTGNS
jgi:acyl-CoA thioesterase I